MTHSQEQLDELINESTQLDAKPRRCCVCGAGELAVALIARILERNDTTTPKAPGYVGHHDAAAILAANTPYRNGEQPLRLHARYCMGRKSWAQK